MQYVSQRNSSDAESGSYMANLTQFALVQTNWFTARSFVTDQNNLHFRKWKIFICV